MIRLFVSGRTILRARPDPIFSVTLSTSGRSPVLLFGEGGKAVVSGTWRRVGLGEIGKTDKLARNGWAGRAESFDSCLKM